MKKTNNKKHIDELISMIMYTRKLDDIQGIKDSIGIIDIEEINHELKLNREAKKCITE